MVPEHIPQILEYLLVVPPEGSSNDRSFKFPFLVSKILNKFNCILDEINERDEWILQILGTLEESPPINAVTSMYFTDLCENLLGRDRKILKVLVKDKCELLFKHLSNRNFNNFVANILGKSAKSEKLKEFTEKIVGSLVEGAKMEDCCANAQEILSTCISEDLVYNIFKAHFKELFINFHESSKHMQKNKLKILKAYLEKEKDLKFIDEDCWGTAETVETIQNYSEIFKQILVTENNPWIRTSMGIEIQTIGIITIIALDIIALLADMRQERVDEIIRFQNLMGNILEVFENHQWSSIFHNNFTNFVMTVLNSNLYSEFLTLLVSFLNKYFFKSDENSQKSDGFLAACYKTGAIIMSFAKSSNLIQENLNENALWPDIEKFLIEKMTVNSNLIEYQ